MTTNQQTDTRPETYEHIRAVQDRLTAVVVELLRRQLIHDDSKLHPPERELFDEYTPKLRGLTYGSDEYKAAPDGLKPALEHHYANNGHHPEHWRDGIRGMSLIDLIEMLCDWSAATTRHADGDIRRSIEINQQRFGYGDELKQVLLNTLHHIAVET